MSRRTSSTLPPHACAVVVCSFLGMCTGFTAAGCVPDTDLVGEVMQPSSTGTEAAAATLLDPLPGSGAVPVNLAAVTVRFPTPVLASEGALTVVGAGRSVGAAIAEPTACPAAERGACFRLSVTETLAPSETYVVALGKGVVEDGGRPVDPGPVGQFVTSAEADLVPPAITAFTVEPAGPCLLVTFQTDSPAAASVRLRGGAAERNVSAGAGLTTFSVPVSIATFGGGNAVEVVARAVDLAANVAETAAVTVTVPLDLLPVAITEVYANAAGPEPAQEFVEIRNLGTEDIDLAGMTFEDAKGADVLPSVVLLAGAYALIVPSGFDAASAVDVPPRAGTPVIRVDSRLGADGLANGGELTRLRSAGGTVLSSYGGFVDVSTTKWAGHAVHRQPEEACDQSAVWTRLPTLATPGSGLP